MNCTIKSESQHNVLALRVADSESSILGLIFAGVLSLFMFLTPIITIVTLKIDFTFGSILVVFVAWYISFYFIRLFLWNKYGEEVITLQKNKIEIYYDYKYFVDNKRVYDFERVKLFFRAEGDFFYACESQEELYVNKVSKIGFVIDEKMIESVLNVPICEIIIISRLLNEDGSFSDSNV